MFNIYKSNRMENLVQALGANLEAPPSNPFAPEYICIQSRGMKQYITIELARKFDVCANTRFIFPKQFITDLIQHCFEENKSCQSLDTDEMFWKIFKEFSQSDNSTQMSTLFEYFNADTTGKKRYQLALKIASIFDDYQVYRPDMINNWQNQRFSHLTSDPSLKWQAVLWNKIASSGDKKNLAGLATILTHEDFNLIYKKKILPQRVSLFGITSLPPLFLQVFKRLADFIDIHMFLMVPSNQFFFDLRSDKQYHKNQLDNPAQDSTFFSDPTITNPLLANMGISAKSFLNTLESFDYHEPDFDLFYDPVEDSNSTLSNSMLSIVQSDILNVVSRKKNIDHPPCKIDFADTSISVHACHSPMREAQVLKDLLLKEFDKDPDLSFHDVIVMMPDIESYAPFIESVFSLENRLGFSISDRKKRSESDTIMAFLNILNLKNERLEKTQVLDLLLSKSIAAKFKIDSNDMPVIEKMTDDANILWGENADHRSSFGLPGFYENTWQFGLSRLFVGMAMPREHAALVQGVSPCNSTEGLELDILGKFAAFCDTIFLVQKRLKKDHTIERWCQLLTSIVDSLIDQNNDNNSDISFLMQTITELKECSTNAGFKETVSFDVVQSYLEHKLDQNISQGNFLAGNITFCNLMPMRSIPYRIVALMGMDEKSFPRKTGRSGFDLIAKHPMPGDKNDRDDNRYLFLETLLSARSKYIVTYTGMNIQDNSMVPCSGVISELCDTLDQSFVFDDEYSYRVNHPLHPFDLNYFTRNTSFFSYSRTNCKIAKALYNSKDDKSSFMDLKPDKTIEEPGAGVSLSQIIRFFKNPMAQFMKETLNIDLPDLEAKPTDRETFKIMGLEQYVLGQHLIEQSQISTSSKDAYLNLNAQGILPYGEKGRLEYLRVQEKAAPIIEQNNQNRDQFLLPSVPVQVTINNLTISSTLSDIHEDGYHILGFGKINGSRLLSAWIEHLFLNITAPDDYPKTTWLTGQDAQGKQPIARYCFSPVQNSAITYFSSLLEMYKKGLKIPLYFFCETAWQIVKVLEQNDFIADDKTIMAAMNKSQSVWQGSAFNKGEIQNRYVDYCLDGKDPFKSPDSFVGSGLVETAIQVYRPLLSHMEMLS